MLSLESPPVLDPASAAEFCSICRLVVCIFAVVVVIGVINLSVDVVRVAVGVVTAVDVVGIVVGVDAVVRSVVLVVDVVVGLDWVDVVGYATRRGSKWSFGSQLM